MIVVRADQKQLKEIQKKLEAADKNAPSVLKKALNETAFQLTKELPPQVKRTYTAKRAAFNNGSMKKKNASVKKLVSVVHVTGATISLSKGFQSKKNNKSSAASAQVLKSGSMTSLELKGGSGIKAFIATMGNGEGKGAHKGIFQRTTKRYMNRKRVTGQDYDKGNTNKPRQLKNGRTTKGRQGIKELYGMSAPKMVENKKVYGKLEPKMGKALQKKLNKFMYQALGEA